MKKADLSLNYIFIIFISVIAVFVIVGMLTNWVFSAKVLMCKLDKTCEEPGMLSTSRTILIPGSVTDNRNFVNEIIKDAKICYERSRRSENRGELCYAIKCAALLTALEMPLPLRSRTLSGQEGSTAQALSTAIRQ